MPNNLHISNTSYPKRGQLQTSKTCVSLSIGSLGILKRGRSKNMLECSSGIGISWKRGCRGLRDLGADQRKRYDPRSHKL